MKSIDLMSWKNVFKALSFSNSPAVCCIYFCVNETNTPVGVWVPDLWLSNYVSIGDVLAAISG